MTMSATAWFADGVRGRHVLLGLVAFFGLIFLVNGVFIYYALSTFGGGDTSDPYRKGLHYNDTLAEAAREAEQGWDAKLIYGASGRLALTLTRNRRGPLGSWHLEWNRVERRFDLAPAHREPVAQAAFHRSHRAAGVAYLSPLAGRGRPPQAVG